MAYQFPNVPGFGFHPTDEQILDYLMLRNQEEFESAPSSNAHIIPDINLCKLKPWDLPSFIEGSTMGGSDRDVWYFFCRRKEKSSSKPSARTIPDVGYWKVTSTKQPVRAGKEIIGTKSILSFQRSDGSSSSDGSMWVIHEYHTIPKEMPFVACRLKKNPGNGSSESSMDTGLAKKQIDEHGDL